MTARQALRRRCGESAGALGEEQNSEPGSERGGSLAVEGALIAVAVALLFAFIIAVGRLSTAESTADTAAQAAARAASIERDPSAAEAAATRAAQTVLATDELRCAQLSVDLDLTDFGLPLGQAGATGVTVRCAVLWSDLGLPAAPGTREVQASAISPIDTWRERP